MSSTAFKLERHLREITSGRHRDDRPDPDTFAAFMRELREESLNLSRQDYVKLETLAERLCGVKR